MYVVRWEDNKDQLHTLVFDDREDAQQKAYELSGMADIEWVYPIEKAEINTKNATVLERIRILERKEDWLSWIALMEALVLAALAWRTVMG